MEPKPYAIECYALDQKNRRQVYSFIRNKYWTNERAFQALRDLNKSPWITGYHSPTSNEWIEFRWYNRIIHNYK